MPDRPYTFALIKPGPRVTTEHPRSTPTYVRKTIMGYLSRHHAGLDRMSPTEFERRHSMYPGRAVTKRPARSARVSDAGTKRMENNVLILLATILKYEFCLPFYEFRIFNFLEFRSRPGRPRTAPTCLDYRAFQRRQQCGPCPRQRQAQSAISEFVGKTGSALACRARTHCRI